MDSRQQTITYSSLRRCALIYITLPLFCFFIGWLKWYWILISCLALTACLVFSEDKDKLDRLFHGKKAAQPGPGKLNEKKIAVSKLWLTSVILFTFVYSIVCGIGRLWAQSDDYPWRNAIFRDIIVRPWPVLYDKCVGALSYYIGMWLPPALPGKLAYLLSGDTEIAFFVGNISMLVYFSIGFIFMMLLLVMYFQPKKTEQLYIVYLGFILFSGLDIFGPKIVEMLFNVHFADGLGHLEWWAGLYQYPAMTNCIWWVFNQTLIPWVCMALLINEKTISGYVLIGMACLFTGPFPFVGFFIYCVANGVKRAVDLLKEKNGKKLLTEIFSVPNVFSVLFVFPFIGTYLTSNSFVDNTAKAESGERSVFSILSFLAWNRMLWIIYGIFILIEFGIFALLIAKANRKDHLFYVTVIQLLLFPFINLGIFSDFTMRASIPALFMMYVLCYRFLIDNWPCKEKKAEAEKAKAKPEEGGKKPRINVLFAALALCLVIGAATPVYELAMGYDQFVKYGVNDIRTDYVVTLNRDSSPLEGEDPDQWPPKTFYAVDLETKPFFKYFARI